VALIQFKPHDRRFRPRRGVLRGETNDEKDAVFLGKPSAPEDGLAEERAAEPIKSLADIRRMSDYFIERGKFRDNLIFIIGINVGLRCGDLRLLRLRHLMRANGSFKKGFPIWEQKTRNTRKRGKNRHITINRAVQEATRLYLEHVPCGLDDYLFRSQSNRGRNSSRPLTRRSVERILKEAAGALNLNMRVATHTLRKTFGYHQMRVSNNDSRKLHLLQLIFGHSSPEQTLCYIGITGEEIAEAYLSLNLGAASGESLLDSEITEFTA
jgi:integrase